MFLPYQRSLCCAALAGLAASVAAAPRPDPLDPQASVPALSYRSALAGYRPLADSAPPSWREVNDTVRRIGGWRSYLREAQQPEAPAAGPATVTTPAPPGRPGRPGQPGQPGHEGHQGHRGHELHRGHHGPAQPGAAR